MLQAAELCLRYAIPLSDAGRALCGDGLSPRQFFERLREAEHYRDARCFLAHALGRWRSLRWGWECTSSVLVPANELLAEVERFLDDPCEERRLLLRDRGLAEPPESPAGYLVLAAFFSGGTVSLPKQPFVPPAGSVTARLVSVAVYMSSIWLGPEHYRERQCEFLERGLRLASAPVMPVDDLHQWQT